MKRLIAVGLVSAVCGFMMFGAAQPETSKPPTSGLDGLAFLKGAWSGTAEGAAVEETWSPARGDSIMGMFRWQSEAGQTTMWELLSIKVEEGKPTLRLRHFDAKFEPWKSEAEGIVPMPASEVSATRVVFSNASDKGGLKSVEYHSPKVDQLLITVSFKDPKREALKFDLKKDK